MFSLMQVASNDSDGDGIMNAAKDRFGLSMHYNALKSFVSSSGATITEIDAETGMPKYTGLSERFINAYLYVNDYFSDPIYSIIPKISEGYADIQSTGEPYQTAFNEGRVLFQLESAGALSRNRSGKLDYGLIGYPKFDINQDYKSPLYYGLSAMVLPSNAENIERTGTVIENLCAYSYETTRPALIQNLLYFKYAKDEPSTRTLNRVLETGTVDVAYIYNWSGVISTIQDAQIARNRNVTSTFSAIEKTLNSAIDITVGVFSKEVKQ